MITCSIIQKSQLEGGLRLDAEYYQPEYLDLISNLKSHKSKFLGEIGEVVYGTTPAGGVFEKKGIPFIRSQNFSLLNISDDFVFCSENFHQRNKKSKVEPGNILFAAIGATIGQLAIIQNNIEEANINQNIAAVRIKDEKINPYFVGLFFASYFGQLQIKRLVTGNAQFYLNTEQIKNFIVPVLEKKSQDKIAEIFREMQKELEKSKNFYSQAENLFLEKLGLKNFEIEHDLSYIVNFSEIRSIHRADAEYYQPKYEKLMSKIKNQNAKLLGEIVSMKKGVEPGSEEYQEKGKNFIRVSSLSKNGIVNKDQKYLKEELYQKLKKDYEPKIGEILLTKDATPGIAYAIKEPIEGIISSGILRLKLRNGEVENEYLAMCLNSIIGRMQAERDGGGSIITHWRPEQIKNVLIPILKQPIQQKIADLVRKSHNAHSKAKQLLEQTKDKIEHFIEN